MSRSLPIVVLILIFAMLAAVVWVANRLDPSLLAAPKPAPSQRAEAPTAPPGASEPLLTGYGDAATPPLEDLRKLQRVAIGYFSVIKDAQRFPIGGNADLAAVLRGENANREVFIRPENPVFSKDGLLLDRWGSPLIVHPLAWRQLELRSAGPDGIPHNEDDILASPDVN